MPTLHFTKGHGTRNDFVAFADPDGVLDLSADQVARLCDRRAGVGGDGILRATRGRHIPEWSGDPDVWFMDYRNADGSIAEMCGNGVRVFLRYLKAAGLVDESVETLDIGTRAGLRTGTYLLDGQLKVWMGRPSVGEPDATLTIGDRSWDARPVDVGNPHAVALLGPDDDLAALDLEHKPGFAPVDLFPHDVNMEFVRVDADHDVTMRVYERGVGETWSCGTGTVAVASAVDAWTGHPGGVYSVHVPGGTLLVELVGTDAYMTGPAELLYSADIDI